MNLKKITNVLSKVRKNIREQGDISQDDEDLLRHLLGEELGKFFEGTSENDNKRNTQATMPVLPEANNDNGDLTKDQQYRLKLLEQSDSTSFAVH